MMNFMTDTNVPNIIFIDALDSSGWVVYSRGSANGSKYIVIDKSMTFNGAQDQCRKYGGYLVHVNSLREQIFLEDFLLQEIEMDG